MMQDKVQVTFKLPLLSGDAYVLEHMMAGTDLFQQPEKNGIIG